MTQPSSRLNPHRSLVALDGEGSTSTGVASLRGRNGESLHVRVVQSQEREDLNMHRVRWVFTEGSETFQVELRHGRTSGIRKIYVNRQLQERIKSVTHLVNAHVTRVNGKCSTRSLKRAHALAAACMRSHFGCTACTSTITPSGSRKKI